MSAEKNLETLRDFLGRMTGASITSGSGWTFVDEIKQLDRAIAEIGRLRNGLAKAAQVIEAGEKDRREILARAIIAEKDRSDWSAANHRQIGVIQAQRKQIADLTAQLAAKGINS
jgi:hypothetical protein